VRFYPFVLGAQPVKPIDLAAFYAAIANEGLRPTPHVIESVERNGSTVYRHDPKSATRIGSVDRAAFYQLKTMLQGVLARGTARSIAGLSPYVAGKTGTSDEENDAWFVGFTNDVTVAVWIGYDNATGKRRTLGGGSTGGGVAVPIFEPVMQAVWANVAPRTALAPPSPEAKRQLACRSVDLESGDVQTAAGRPITECFRIDRYGQVIDTQYRLVSRESAYIMREPGGYYGVEPNYNPYGYNNGYYNRRPGYYYYDHNSGRYVPAPRDSYRYPGQHYGQPAPQARDPRAHAPAPRDPYGRQTPQPFDPFNLFGNRRSY
jgi:membrane peptidoglycan carboxypeptidase